MYNGIGDIYSRYPGAKMAVVISPSKQTMKYYNTLIEFAKEHKFNKCSNVFLSAKNKIPTIKIGNDSESTIVCASLRVQASGTIKENQTFSEIKGHKCATLPNGYHKFISEPIEMLDITADLK